MKRIVYHTMYGAGEERFKDVLTIDDIRSFFTEDELVVVRQWIARPEEYLVDHFTRGSTPSPSYSFHPFVQKKWCNEMAEMFNKPDKICQILPEEEEEYRQIEPVIEKFIATFNTNTLLEW